MKPNARVSSAIVATALCAVLACTRGVRAQVPDLVDVQVQYLPDVAVATPMEGVALRAQVSSYDVALNVPLVLGGRTFLVPGLAYHVDAVSYSGAPDGFAELRAFHALEVPILFVHLLPNDWALALRVAPGLAGDLVSVDARTLRLSAAAMVTHALSPRLTLGGGVVVSAGFGEPLVLPALHLRWDIAACWRFEAFVPAFAHLVWTPLRRLELGLRVDVAGQSYAVRDPRTPALDHVSYSVIAVSLGASLAVWESLWLSASIGHTVYRRFEPQTRDDRPADDGAQTLPNALVVRVGLTLRLPTTTDHD